MPSFANGFLMILILLVTSAPLLAQDDKPRTAYEMAWEDISELLRRREYSSAIARLDALAEKRDLRDSGKQMEADKKVIDGLQTLERVVLEQAAKLEPGTTIEISGIEYTFVRYEKSSRGDALILKSRSLGRENKKLIADLPSGTWAELAEADLEAMENPTLTLGVFLGFDRIADRRAARKLLNEAASRGDDVTPWLARLEAAEVGGKTDEEDAKGDGDPIVGKWMGFFGPPPKAVPATYEFRKDGTGNITIDSKTLEGYARREAKNPEDYTRIKREFRKTSFKWEKKESSYTLTTKEGLTVDKISVDEDRMVWPFYRDFVRQVGRQSLPGRVTLLSYFPFHGTLVKSGLIRCVFRIFSWPPLKSTIPRSERPMFLRNAAMTLSFAIRSQLF